LWLTIIEDGQPRSTVEVTGSAFSIGREPDCDMVLDDPKVSRRHAAIEVGGSVRVLHDLDSSNGTLVDGEPVRPMVGFATTPERIAELQGGEVLQFGDTVVLATLADPRHVMSPNEPS
jgi:pSer/pThr/pTyr-binding forkhead associated (FHA) protein